MKKRTTVYKKSTKKELFKRIDTLKNPTTQTTAKKNKAANEI
jgi:hypothetical protein